MTASDSLIGPTDTVLRALIATSTDIIAIVGREGELRFLSRALPGGGPAPVVGTSFCDCFPATERNGLEGSFRSVEESGATVELDVELDPPEGPPVVLSLRIGTILRGTHSEGFIVLLSDTSEQDSSNRRLRESELRYRRLIEDQTEFVVRWRPDGTRTFVNGSYCRYFGGTPEKLVGSSFFPLIAEEDQERVRRKIAGLTAEHPTATQEHRVIRGDGTIGWNEWTDRAIFDASGRLVEMQSLGRDITERKEAEERLQASEERLRLATRLEAVGQLAGGVAHDFNNLLTVIIGNVELLEAELGAGGLAGIECAVEIRRAATRAATLTRQLLAFGRRQMMLPVPINLNEVLLGMEGMLRGLVSEGIEVELTLDPELRSILADPSQIELVLVNLVLNARDAMPESGRLLIGTQSLRRNVPSDSAEVAEASYVARLTVRDDGHGIAPEIQDRIFEPFFTTKEVGKGTGLGLSSVYGIVQQSGGRIEVESEVGRGTEIRIELPLLAAETSRPDAPDNVSPAGGRETILLVEDDDAVRELAQRLLAGAGYDVLVAEGADEAINLAAQHGSRIGLVLSDVVMPKMSGFHLAERLRETLPKVAILFMSGHSRELLESFGGGAQTLALLNKPFDRDTLLTRVRQQLDEAASGSAAPAAPAGC